MRGKGIAVLAALAFVPLVAPPADAAVGGLSYRQAYRLVPTGESASKTALCRGGSSVVGGGVDIVGGHNLTTVRSSRPVDSGDAGTTPDDGWSATMNNGAPTDRLMTVFAICASKGRFRYVKASQDLLAPDVSSKNVFCPNGQYVTGGGAGLSGKQQGVRLNWSINIDGDEDGDPTPDDGWFAKARNTSSIDSRITTYAICTRTPLVYVEDTASINTEGFAQPLQIDCPAGKVLGGGLFADSADAVHSTFPLDGADVDGSANDAWLGRIIKSAGGADPYVVRAICV
jgi:hypothetical protein